MEKRNDYPTATRQYLIVEANVLVASDLLETIMEWKPKASVTVCRTPDAACELLRNRGAVDMVILGIGGEALRRSALLDWLEDHPVRLVVMEGVLKNGLTLRRGHATLARPFVAEMVHAALSSAAGEAAV